MKKNKAVLFFLLSVFMLISIVVPVIIYSVIKGLSGFVFMFLPAVILSIILLWVGFLYSKKSLQVKS